MKDLGSRVEGSRGARYKLEGAGFTASWSRGRADAARDCGGGFAWFALSWRSHLKKFS